MIIVVETPKGVFPCPWYSVYSFYKPEPGERWPISCCSPARTPEKLANKIREAERIEEGFSEISLRFESLAVLRSEGNLVLDILNTHLHETPISEHTGRAEE